MVKMNSVVWLVLVLLGSIAVAISLRYCGKLDTLWVLLGCLVSYGLTTFTLGAYVASGQAVTIGSGWSNFIPGHVYLTLAGGSGNMDHHFVIKDGASSELLLVSYTAPGDALLPSRFTVNERGNIIDLSASTSTTTPTPVSGDR